MERTLTGRQMMAYRAVWAVYPPVDVSVGAYLGYGEAKKNGMELVEKLKASNANRGGVG